MSTYLGIHRIVLFLDPNSFGRFTWLNIFVFVFAFESMYLYLYLNYKLEQNICIWKIQIFVFVFVFDKTYLTPALTCTCACTCIYVYVYIYFIYIYIICTQSLNLQLLFNYWWCKCTSQRHKLTSKECRPRYFNWWSNHIRGVSNSKASRGIGMIIKTPYFYNQAGLLCFYFSFTYPHLTHCDIGSVNLHRLVFFRVS